jgi:GxxExxY protein
MESFENLTSHLYDVISALYTVHKELGPGINEYCYQEAFAMELTDRSIPFEKEKVFSPLYKGRKMNCEYRIDFLCKSNIIIECKSVSRLLPVHRAQLFNYMRLLKMPYGIIVNFMNNYAEVERYFFDIEKKEILSPKGVAIKGS